MKLIIEKRNKHAKLQIFKNTVRHIKNMKKTLSIAIIILLFFV